MKNIAETKLSKVPELTIVFWVIKIIATTLGETGGDAVSMSMNLGYLVGTAIFGVIFIISVYTQISSKSFHPFLYWITIVATTTVGTTMADFVTRDLGIGYTGGSSLLLTLLLFSLLLWYKTLGSISINTINSSKAEMFYWLTIMLSQTLGTALGDWTADTQNIGYLGSATIFIVLLALVVVAHYFTKVSNAILFWVAFILTRPLGAVVGDFLDKPISSGGLALSRYSASVTLIVFMVALICIFPQRAARTSH